MNRYYRGKPTQPYRNYSTDDYIVGFLVYELLHQKINGQSLAPAIIPVNKDGYADFDEHGDLITVLVTPETIGQETNVHTEDGISIYAGDYIEAYSGDSLVVKGKVEFGNGSFVIKENEDDEGYCLCLAHSENLNIKIVKEEKGE